LGFFGLADGRAGCLDPGTSETPWDDSWTYRNAPRGGFRFCLAYGALRSRKIIDIRLKIGKSETAGSMVKRY
jgi:hypothetical protein